MLMLCGVYFGLIILQPNLSTTITVCGIIIGMMFVAGLHIMYLVGIVGVGAVGILFMILTDEDGYRLKKAYEFPGSFQDPLEMDTKLYNRC